MNKRLLNEINSFRRLVKLPLINEQDGPEGEVAKALTDLIFKDESILNLEKQSASGQIQKITLKPDYVENLIKKDVSVLTPEEKEVLHSLGDNMIKVYTPKEIAQILYKNSQIITDAAIRREVRSEILDKYFNDQAKAQINNEIAIISKGARPQPIQNVQDTPISLGINPDDIKIEIPQYISSSLPEETVRTLTSTVEQIMKNDFKLGNFQGFTKAEFDEFINLINIKKELVNQEDKRIVNNVIVELKKKQVELEDLDIEAKKLDIASKEMDIQQKKDSNNLDLKRKKSEIRLLRIKNLRIKISIIGSMKVFILTIWYLISPPTFKIAFKFVVSRGKDFLKFIYNVMTRKSPEENNQPSDDDKGEADKL